MCGRGAVRVRVCLRVCLKRERRGCAATEGQVRRAKAAMSGGAADLFE